MTTVREPLLSLPRRETPRGAKDMCGHLIACILTESIGAIAQNNRKRIFLMHFPSTKSAHLGMGDIRNRSYPTQAVQSGSAMATAKFLLITTENSLQIKNGYWNQRMNYCISARGFMRLYPACLLQSQFECVLAQWHTCLTSLSTGLCPWTFHGGWRRS